MSLICFHLTMSPTKIISDGPLFDGPSRTYKKVFLLSRRWAATHVKNTEMSPPLGGPSSEGNRVVVLRQAMLCSPALVLYLYYILTNFWAMFFAPHVLIQLFLLRYKSWNISILLPLFFLEKKISAAIYRFFLGAEFFTIFYNTFNRHIVTQPTFENWAYLLVLYILLFKLSWKRVDRRLSSSKKRNLLLYYITLRLFYIYYAALLNKIQILEYFNIVSFLFSREKKVSCYL